MIISVNFNNEELKIIKEICKKNNMSMEDYIKKVLLEKVKN